MEEKRDRIKTWMAACMIIVALFIDAVQAVLTILLIGVVLGPIISVAAYLIFWIWFKILGVSFAVSPKKMGTMMTTAVGELFLGFLPVFTAGIAAVIFMTRAEDKGGLLGKAANIAQGKIKP